VHLSQVGCPGAAATIRRRRAAIAHHHRAAGQPAPVDPSRNAGQPTRELIDPWQVDMLMRLLPSHGWTAGLFGRRGRALLTLAAAATIPYRQLPRLTPGLSVLTLNALFPHAIWHPSNVLCTTVKPSELRRCATELPADAHKRSKDGSAGCSGDVTVYY